MSTSVVDENRTSIYIRLNWVKPTLMSYFLWSSLSMSIGLRQIKVEVGGLGGGGSGGGV